MSMIGRLCALAALTVAGVTAMFWDGGTSPVSRPSLDGAALFHAKGCASCHDGPDSAARVGGFPSLDDATDWAAHRRPDLTARDYLAESIIAPDVFVSPAFTGGNGPATAMPNLAVTTDEVDALVDYLMTK